MSEPASETLLPCAHCGDDQPGLEASETGGDRTTRRIWIRCKACGVDGPACSTGQAAAIAWNHRARPQSSAPSTEAVADEYQAHVGWKLVPIAPTVAMLKAAAEEGVRIRRAHDDVAIGPDYYRAMVAAAPEPPILYPPILYPASVVSRIAGLEGALTKAREEGAEAAWDTLTAALFQEPAAKPQLPASTLKMKTGAGLSIAFPPPRSPSMNEQPASERRPANCRMRLQEEGKPYPPSLCMACGENIVLTCPQSSAPSTEAVAWRNRHVCHRGTDAAWDVSIERQPPSPNYDDEPLYPASVVDRLRQDLARLEASDKEWGRLHQKVILERAEAIRERDEANEVLRIHNSDAEQRVVERNNLVASLAEKDARIAKLEEALVNAEDTIRRVILYNPASPGLVYSSIDDLLKNVVGEAEDYFKLKAFHELDPAEQAAIRARSLSQEPAAK